MNINFKLVEEAHLPGIQEIYNYYAVNTTISFHTEPVDMEEMRGNVLFSNPRYQTFIISTDEEHMAGYVLISQHKKKQAYDVSGEVTIYLKPNFTGRGIGKKALEFIEQFARDKDFHVLVATICAENERSKTLFERNGYFQCAHYREIGSKFGRRLDVITFQKILN